MADWLRAFALLLMIGIPSAEAFDKVTVILDPGHGGDDTGAIRWMKGRRVSEKELTLSLAKRTAQVLRTRGFRVILTRDTDRFVTLDQRTEIANRTASTFPNSIFVSIHANSNDESRSSGVETYVFNATTNDASLRLADLENGKRPASPGRRVNHPITPNHPTLDLIMSDLATTASYGESMRLACSVQSAVVNGLQTHRTPVRNRGIRQALFYVLMQSRMPSILFEPGFVSNPQELTRLMTPSYQLSVARSLANGIMTWKSQSKPAQRLCQVH